MSLSKDQLLEIIQSVPGCVFQFVMHTDGSLSIPYMSDALEESTGIKAEFLIRDANRIYDFIHPDDLERFNLAFHESAQNLSMWDLEFRVITPDNRTIWIKGSSNPRRREDGSIIWNGVLTDFTEYKQTEESLRESEERYRAMFEKNRTVKLLIDPSNGEIVSANPAAIKFYGYPRDELIGKRIQDINTLEESAVHDEMQKAAAEKKGLFNFRHRLASGEIRDVEVHSSPFTSSGRKYLYSIVYDTSERTKSIEALQESEQNLRYILKHDPNAIAVYDKDLRYIAVSDRYLEDYNVTNKNIIGKHHYEVFPEMPRKWKEVHQRCLNGAVERNDDDYFVRPDGSVTYNRWECRPWYKRDGSIGGIITYTEVTTERKKMELELKDTIRRLRLATESANLGVWDWDIVNDKMIWDDRMFELYGITSEQFTGNVEVWKNGLHPDDAKEAIALCEAVLRGEDKFDTEFRVLHPDGTVKLLKADGLVVRDDADNPIRMIGLNRDITEEREAEQKIHEAVLRQKAAVEAGNVGLWDWDLKTNKVHYSSEWKRQIGYEDHEISDSFEEWQSRVHPDDLDDILEKIKKFISRKKQNYEVEFRFRHKDGSYRWIMARASVICNDNGTPVRTLGSHVDITDRIESERALRESEQRVRRKLTAIMEPEGDIGELELADVIDIGTIQSLMESFHKLTKIGVGIIDLDGNVLIGTDWQEICTRFHRVHPETRKNCLDSDMVLSKGAEPGSFKAYRCKNNIRDIATPIIVGGKHLGNLFLGQFLFEEEEIDYELYRNQARKYGFDEEEYMKALEKLPRWNSETIEAVMEFYSQLSDIISSLSHGNIKLARSLTERERLLEELRKSENKYRTYINNSPIAILVTNSEGQYVEVNGSACNMLGYSHDEIIGKSISDLPTLEHGRSAMAAYDELRRYGYLRREFRFARKDSSMVDVDLEAVQLENDLYVAFCSDITETKRLRALESRAERLETAGTIAGQVAHDFNNLLAPLMAYPEFIREDLPKNHPALTYVDQIEQASKKIADINQDLLTMGRRGHYNQEILNLNTIVQHVTSEIDISSGTLAFDLDLSDDLMDIMGGKSQIYRVISNLVANARDAMQDIGTITIRTENYYIDNESVKYSRVPVGEYVRLTISDTGCGIPDKILQKIFDPFFTSKTADKRRGSGLGMSVVDAVVKDHNGYIDLSTKVGEGTSFYIYFPVTRKSQDSHGSRNVSGGNERILIVDDDEVQRSVSSRILESLGYEVDIADNGECALRAIRMKNYDLLILDMIMPPGMNGAQTYRRVLEITPGQRAIIVSGFAETDHVLQAQKLGAGAFIRKPFNKQTIAAAVRNELDRATASTTVN